MIVPLAHPNNFKLHPTHKLNAADANPAHSLGLAFKGQLANLPSFQRFLLPGRSRLLSSL